MYAKINLDKLKESFVMKIRNVDFGKSPLFLAPMAGVSDVGFREQAVKFGADATVTEMLSTRAMVHNPKKTNLMTITSPYEKLVVAQIFGHESEFMVKAFESEILDKFPAFDINMGCPAPKILKNGDGAALMDSIHLAGHIIETCREMTDKPLSVKFRKGYHQENYLDFAKMCEDSGADYVIFHARTVEQGYSGEADYEAIANVKAKLHIPVIGNGDVVSVDSYHRMLETGVDGVMIGRAALGRPWLIAQVHDYLEKGVEPPETEIKQIKDALLKHLKGLLSYYGERTALGLARKYVCWYCKNLRDARKFREKYVRIDNMIQALEEIDNFFTDENLLMTEDR